MIMIIVMIIIVIKIITLHKKWNFSLRLSSVNVTKSAGNCGFDHIYWRNPLWKTSFFVQCKLNLSHPGFTEILHELNGKAEAI